MNIPRSSQGFTLLEVIVSLAIIIMLLLVLVSITDATRRTWTYTRENLEQMQDAREGLESLLSRLGQATLNTYWDYDNAAAPTQYKRQSELRFIAGQASSLLPPVTDASGNPVESVTHAVFFQASAGYVVDTASFGKNGNLLNTWGYFIEFGSEKPYRADFLNNMDAPPADRYRFRLMELMEPSESLTLYKAASSAGGNEKYTTASGGTDWFTTPYAGQSPYSASTRPVRVVAENIIALIVLPRLSPQDEQQLKTSGTIPASTALGTALAPDYAYDSTVANTNAALDSLHQLPPVIQVTLVAVDDSSFQRYQSTLSGATMPALVGSELFKTAANYDADMQTLKNTLAQHKIKYRVFTTSLSIKAAKWSR